MRVRNGARHLDGAEIARDVVAWMAEPHPPIRDGAAAGIAAWWQSSGSIGRTLGAYASGLSVEAEELEADIDRSVREADRVGGLSDADRNALEALRSWIRENLEDDWSPRVEIVRPGSVWDQVRGTLVRDTPDGDRVVRLDSPGGKPAAGPELVFAPEHVRHLED